LRVALLLALVLAVQGYGYETPEDSNAVIYNHHSPVAGPDLRVGLEANAYDNPNPFPDGVGEQEKREAEGDKNEGAEEGADSFLSLQEAEVPSKMPKTTTKETAADKFVEDLLINEHDDEALHNSYTSALQAVKEFSHVDEKHEASFVEQEPIPASPTVRFVAVEDSGFCEKLYDWAENPAADPILPTDPLLRKRRKACKGKAKSKAKAKAKKAAKKPKAEPAPGTIVSKSSGGGNAASAAGWPKKPVSLLLKFDPKGKPVSADDLLKQLFAAAAKAQKGRKGRGRARRRKASKGGVVINLHIGKKKKGKGKKGKRGGKRRRGGRSRRGRGRKAGKKGAKDKKKKDKKKGKKGMKGKKGGKGGKKPKQIRIRLKVH